jgi:peptide/nickel transport system permease protein
VLNGNFCVTLSVENFMPIITLWIPILKRLAWLVPIVLVSSALGFFLMRFQLTVGPVILPATLTGNTPIVLLEKIELKQPIDPLAELRLNPQLSASAIAQEEHRLALDKPWYIQYWRWLTAFLQGDWGTTNRGESVSWLLLGAAKNTILLNLCVLTCTWLIGLPLGVLAAQYAGTWVSNSLNVVTSLLMAIPSFVLALGLGVLAIKTGILPFGGLTSPMHAQLPFFAKVWDVVLHLALPTLVLTLLSITGVQRQMQANMLDVLGQPYIQTAKAKGLPQVVILYKHAIRNALNPLLTLLGFELAGLLSGAVLVETVLGFPGLGLQTYQASLSGDANMVMASLVLSSLLLVLGNLLADIGLLLLDPRIRTRGA